MKACIAVFVLMVAGAAALGPGYAPGLRHVPGGVAALYRNDLRQVAVNHQAEYVGSGTGIARYDRVPGAGNDFRHGYVHGGYGFDVHGPFPLGYDNYRPHGWNVVG